MAKTAGELCNEIEEYLNYRIRPKPKDVRTTRESRILSRGEAFCEDLRDQENAKQQELASALEIRREALIDQLLEVSSAARRLRRSADHAEEEGK